MSLSDRQRMPSGFSVMLALVLTAPAAIAQKNDARHELSCPPSIRVTETVAAVHGWKGSTVSEERAFDSVSVYNGEDGGKEYDLAPDDQQQRGKKTIATWNLKGYRTMNIFMRCRYRDTSAVLSMDLPSQFETCTYNVELDSKGNSVGTPVASCR